MDTMTSDKTTTRRRYSPDFKAQVVGECNTLGASVAKVAMSHGINTNVVHGWRKMAREAGAASPAPSREFVPVVLPAAPMHSVAERGIEVELRRGTLTMKITWPSSATADFAGWTRELLRWSGSTPCGWRSRRWTCAPARSRRWPGWSTSSAPPARITRSCSPTGAPTA